MSIYLYHVVTYDLTSVHKPECFPVICVGVGSWKIKRLKRSLCPLTVNQITW